jgi:hypothetical protein
MRTENIYETEELKVAILDRLVFVDIVQRQTDKADHTAQNYDLRRPTKLWQGSETA